jgi:hypothetical protein
MIPSPCAVRIGSTQALERQRRSTQQETSPAISLKSSRRRSPEPIITRPTEGLRHGVSTRRFWFPNWLKA